MEDGVQPTPPSNLLASIFDLLRRLDASPNLLTSIGNLLAPPPQPSTSISPLRRDRAPRATSSSPTRWSRTSTSSSFSRRRRSISGNVNSIGLSSTAAWSCSTRILITWRSAARVPRRSSIRSNSTADFCSISAPNTLANSGTRSRENSRLMSSRSRTPRLARMKTTYSPPACRPPRQRTRQLTKEKRLLPPRQHPLQPQQRIPGSERSPDAVRKPSARTSDATDRGYSNLDTRWRLRGKRAAVLLFSHYPADPRPRRAAEALAMEGVQIDLICLQADRDEPRRENVNGVRVVRVPLRRQRGGKLSYIGQYSSFLLTSFAYLAFRSLTRRYDFVHVHNMPDVLVFSALVPKMLGARVVLDLHDPMPELMQTIFKLPEDSFSVRVLKRFEKWSIGFADLVLTVNVACKKHLFGPELHTRKINVVLNSPDDHIFSFRAPHHNGTNGGNGRDMAKPFVILYHGSLVQRNGFDLAVDALQSVKKIDPRGAPDGLWSTNTVLRYRHGIGHRTRIEKEIDYLGVRSVEQIVDAINTCDLGIIPNHRNIFTEINTPTRIFEYLALGKPVIAPRAQGIQDYFGERDLVLLQTGRSRRPCRTDPIRFLEPGRGRTNRQARAGRVSRSHMEPGEIDPPQFFWRVTLTVEDGSRASRSGTGAGGRHKIRRQSGCLK